MTAPAEPRSVGIHMKLLRNIEWRSEIGLKQSHDKIDGLA